MATPLDRKSTTEEIRERFDGDVERFANLDTGQQATIDAPLAMELITRAAVACTPHARRVLDIGCGAGNNTLKLLEQLPSLDCDLVDLSRPMLDRAFQRVSSATSGDVRALEGDIRQLPLEAGRYDVVLAAAVLHHLRGDADWERTFAKIHAITAPGGSVWITDLVSQENPAVAALMWRRYGDYLAKIGGNEYRDRVFAYVDREDSPRSLTYQLDLLRRVGFCEVEVLHKNSCFAAFGTCKPI